MNYYATWFWNLYARAYDHLLRISPYRDYLRDIVRLLDPQADLTVELGCGTGNIWLTALQSPNPPEGQIVLLDASPVMLTRATLKLARYSNVSVRYGDMRQRLDFPDGSVNQVVLANSLYTSPNPSRLLQEIGRVLPPNGRLIVSDPSPTFRISAIFQGHLKENILESGTVDNTFGKNFRILLRGARHDRTLRQNLVPLSFILWINTKLLQRQPQFLSQEELHRALINTGFSIDHSQTTYAGQNNLVLARKTA